MEDSKKGEKKYWSFRGIINFIKDVISWTVFILLLIIAVLLLYCVIASYRYSKKGRGYEPLYTIVSPSMEPNIKVYDVIIDLPIRDFRDVKVNDVITFKSESSISKGMTVTHRVTDIKKVAGRYYFTTKGDNNQSIDSSLVSQDSVLGKVKYRIPQLGRVQYFLSSRGGWLIVILIPAVIILIADVIKLVRMIKISKKVNELQDDNDEPKINKIKTKKNEIDLDDEPVKLPKLKK